MGGSNGACSVHATGPLAVLDFETTGVDVENDRIVQVGFVLESAPGVVMQEHSFLMKSGVPIPAEATAVHGITDADVEATGLEVEEFLDAVQLLLTSALSAGVPLVIFNAPFDLTLLNAEFVRAGRGGFEAEDVGMVIDPLVIDKALDRFRRGSRKLTDMAAHYRVPVKDAHTGLGDCHMTAGVARAIAGRIPVEVDDETLYNKQRDWYAQQQTNYAEYRESIGKPLDSVSVEWPVASLSRTIDN